MIIRAMMTAVVLTGALTLAPTASISAEPDDIQALTAEGQMPAVSEDGARVAYVDNAYRIWAVSRDGRGSKQLTAGYIDMNPAWSPDGRKIAFRRCTFSDGSSHSDVWIMNADGSGQVALTDARTTTGYYDHPVWSPDGAMLAMEAAVNGMMSEIYVIEIMSKRIVNATRMNTGQNNRFDHQSPIWLADGERLTALRNDELVIVDLQPMLARLNSPPSARKPTAYVAAASTP